MDSFACRIGFPSWSIRRGCERLLRVLHTSSGDSKFIGSPSFWLLVRNQADNLLPAHSTVPHTVRSDADIASAVWTLLHSVVWRSRRPLWRILDAIRADPDGSTGNRIPWPDQGKSPRCRMLPDRSWWCTYHVVAHSSSDVGLTTGRLLGALGLDDSP